MAPNHRQVVGNQRQVVGNQFAATHRQWALDRPPAPVATRTASHTTSHHMAHPRPSPHTPDPYCWQTATGHSSISRWSPDTRESRAEAPFPCTAAVHGRPSGIWALWCSPFRGGGSCGQGASNWGEIAGKLRGNCGKIAGKCRNCENCGPQPPPLTPLWHRALS